MTFNDDARINMSRVSKRGRTTGFAVGGGGLGLVAVVIISQLLGVDLTGLVDQGQQPVTSEPIANCETGEDANANVECRMAATALVLDTYWADELPKLGTAYRSPGFGLFSQSTSTGCGAASSATGPFYCPPDETIYLDTTFYEELRSRFGASGGPLAEMYVVAHEWGHHIQTLTGTSSGLDLRDTGEDSDSVRLELQADCYAGAWVGAAATIQDENGVTFLEPITEAQLADALSAASAVGDDRIQSASPGGIQPDTWTHGSSEQRQRWFTTGYEGGPERCDTFAVPRGDL